jgi:hypothetical protein
MPFRDEAEALRSRLEAVETDLKRAEAELERSREKAAEAEELREALAKIEAQLAEVRGERINPRAQRTAAAVLAGGMALVVAGAMVARATIAHVPVSVAPRAAVSHARPVMLPRPSRADQRGWFAPRLFSASVEEALGNAPVPVGTRCDVLVAATEIDMLDCRVTITCNDEVLYGGEHQGYVPCRVLEGEPTTGEDLSGIEDDGDPMLDMDIPNRRIVVTNDRPSIWRTDLTIFEPQRVRPAGVFVMDEDP